MIAEFPRVAFFQRGQITRGASELEISDDQLPRDYNTLVAAGRTTWPGDAYLDALDAEWIPRGQLGNPTWFFSEPIPGLLPFAFSAGRDLWCWRLDVPTADREFEILLAPRDCTEGELWAPSISTWAFRKAIDEATTSWDTESQTRKHLKDWGCVLRSLGHEELAATLDSINARLSREKVLASRSWRFLIEPEEYEDIVIRVLGSKFWKTSMTWTAE